MQTITIGYLYPEYMNIYGDTGNIVTLRDRAERRGIKVTIVPISINDELKPNTIDIYFFGGGQDQQQEYITKDLPRIGDTIREDIEKGACALTICGGYQLFGKFYRPFDKADLVGLSIFPVETSASNVRMIDNIVIQLEESLYREMLTQYKTEVIIPQTLVGFENHSGQTTFVGDCLPLGKTLYGYGNNETKTTEGCHVKNAFGAYLHGSLLPKNPHFADYLIKKALEYRYNAHITLDALDDTLEYKAHHAIVNKYLPSRSEN